MTLKKRGLGRGLEALLADTPAKEDGKDAEGQMYSGEVQSSPIAFDSRKKQPSLSSNSFSEERQAELAVAVIKQIHRERLKLLEEAEALIALIDEFEMTVRADVFKE